MDRLIVVAVGGALGAVLRHLSIVLAGRLLGLGFPFGTLFVNVTGSFLVGVLFVVLARNYPLDHLWRLGVIVGVLGGYTTFSAFSLETLILFQQGRILLAALNVALSLGLCLAAVAVGFVVASAK